MATHEKTGPARELYFETLDAAVAEARRLLEAGYTRAGNWTLAQAAGHCAEWIDYSMAGTYPVPLPMRPIFAVVNRTIGPRLLRATLSKRRMAAGTPTFPTSIPAVLGTDQSGEAAQRAVDAAAVEQLADAARRLTSWKAALPRSPIFGKLTHQESAQLHCIHIAHHLGFLVPMDSGPQAR